MMEKFNLDSLTPEQREKLKGIKNKEDLMNFIDEQDIDLTAEQMDAVSGGWDYWEEFNYQFKGD